MPVGCNVNDLVQLLFCSTLSYLLPHVSKAITLAFLEFGPNSKPFGGLPNDDKLLLTVHHLRKSQNSIRANALSLNAVYKTNEKKTKEKKNKLVTNKKALTRQTFHHKIYIYPITYHHNCHLLFLQFQPNQNLYHMFFLILHRSMLSIHNR